MQIRLTAWALMLTYLVIVLGAATRVFDAGMSCPDWPTCYGVWNPFHPGAVPDGGYVVNGVTYTVFQVSLEWTHRLCVALLGGLLVIATLGHTRMRDVSWWPLVATWVLLGLQIKLGALTVWLGNVNWSVVLHLGNAMLVLAALAWYGRALRAGPGPYKLLPEGFVYRSLVVLMALLVWVAMLAGAYISSSHAGGICGGLFSCGGTWMPHDTDQMVHMGHRYLACAVVVMSIVLMMAGRGQPETIRKSAVALHMMIWGQVALGVGTLYSFTMYPAYYEYLSLGHLAWGTMVFLIATGMVLNLVYGKSGRFHA